MYGGIDGHKDGQIYRKTDRGTDGQSDGRVILGRGKQKPLQRGSVCDRKKVFI